MLGSNDDLRQIQWALDRIRVPDGATSQTDIGIADSGINPIEQLAENVVGGWNFYLNTPDYHDDSSHHGTSVAGVVASDLGALSHARLWALNCGIPDTRRIDILAFSRSVDFAIEKNIKVINCSFGAHLEPSETLKQAVAKAEAAGILIIAACGNDGLDNDVPPGNIWNLPNANLIRVASTNEDEDLIVFFGRSNWGRGSVELAAPGNQILLVGSTNLSFTWGGGTSLAAPWVTALAAMLRDQFSDHREVIRRMLGTVDRIPKLESKLWSGGRLRIDRALAGDFNPPLDTVTLEKVKLKNHKKLKITATTKLIESPPSETAALLRVWANDSLLGFITLDNGTNTYQFSAKKKLPSGAFITVQSSRGGEAKWIVP